MRKLPVYLLLWAASIGLLNVCRAQEIRNGLSYRNISGKHYLRLNYENDLAFHTDYYYTQGVHFEIVSPGLARAPLTWMFPGLKKPKSATG